LSFVCGLVTAIFFVGCTSSADQSHSSPTTTSQAIPTSTSISVPDPVEAWARDLDLVLERRLAIEADRDSASAGETITITGSGCTAKGKREPAVSLSPLPDPPNGNFALVNWGKLDAVPRPDGSFVIPVTANESYAGVLKLQASCRRSPRLSDPVFVSNAIAVTFDSPYTIDFPSTVRVGEVVHFTGTCLSDAAGYMHLALAFESPISGMVDLDPRNYFGARPSDDGVADASAPITAPPGRYLIRPTCSVERSPPERAFKPFYVTVEP
jgi:hypothetical protein